MPPFFSRFFSATARRRQTELDAAKKWLETCNHQQIPRNLFTITYSRSSGPGGQKVNKTSLKATVSLEPFQWLNPKFCSWIPSPVLTQLQHKAIRFQTKAGGLVIQSDVSRNREANTDECFRKLLDSIKECTYFETETSEEDREKWERVAARQKAQRLEDKRRQRDRRQLRSRKFDI